MRGLEAMWDSLCGFRARWRSTGSEEQERHAGAAAVPFAPPPHSELSHGSIRAWSTTQFASFASGTGAATVFAAIAEPTAPGRQPLEVQVVLKNLLSVKYALYMVLEYYVIAFEKIYAVND